MPRLLVPMLLLAILAPAASASARLSEEYTYTYEQLWQASVRLIAVDFRFPITDRDPEIGYMLFSYREQGRDYQGSLELVRTQGPYGGAQVRVVMQVASMPTYVERMMLDRLERKLSADYGQPPAARRPAPPPTPPATEEPDGDDAEDESPSRR